MDTLPFDCTVRRTFDYEFTPELAEMALSVNSFNRPFDQSYLKRYTKDMLDGNWTECSGCIVFGNDGKLKDGQHRLKSFLRAFKESGGRINSLSFTVKTGWTKDEAANIDCGKKRSYSDALRMQYGSDVVKSDIWGDFTKALNVLYRDGVISKNTQITRTEMNDILYTQHYEAFLTLCANLNGRYVGRKRIALSGYGAAFILALESGVSISDILAFCDYVEIGVPDDESYDTRARRLLVAALKKRYNSICSTRNKHDNIWLEKAVEDALYHFCRNESSCTFDTPRYRKSPEQS